MVALCDDMWEKLQPCGGPQLQAGVWALSTSLGYWEFRPDFRQGLTTCQGQLMSETWSYR